MASPLVIVVGGCVTDVLGVKSYSVWDWDNFEDNPVAYWEDYRTDEERELVRRLFDPEAYADILAAVSKARLEQGV